VGIGKAEWEKVGDDNVRYGNVDRFELVRGENDRVELGLEGLGIRECGEKDLLKQRDLPAITGVRVSSLEKIPALLRCRCTIDVHLPDLL
jgi:hypothetical protein